MSLRDDEINQVKNGDDMIAVLELQINIHEQLCKQAVDRDDTFRRTSVY